MAPYRPVHVWNGLIRLTHWVNALCVICLLLIGGLIWAREPLGIAEHVEEAMIDVHAAIGFVFAAFLLARLGYALAGPPGPGHWRDILPLDAWRRQELMDTLRFYLGGFRGRGPVYFAHNALAGIAYAGFFLLALSQIMTGATMYLLGPAMPEAAAHAAHEHVPQAGQWPPAWLHVPHEIGALLIAVFILAHLLMLVVHELLETRGLASSMISGNKFFTEEELARMGHKEEGNE